MEHDEPFAGNVQSGLSYKSEANSSGLSWAAVIGGAFVTAALSVILLALGAGLGLSSISPWSNVGSHCYRTSVPLRNAPLWDKR
jgi:hypothetical protein